MPSQLEKIFQEMTPFFLLRRWRRFSQGEKPSPKGVLLPWGTVPKVDLTKQELSAKVFRRRTKAVS